MKNTTQHITLILTVLLILPGILCFAANITVTGSWSETIDSADLQSGAGSDLNGTYQSASTAVTINTDVQAEANTYRVDVSKSDTTWHGDFTLYVRRTTDGTGIPTSTISGGTTYQAVTGTDTSFFTGKSDRDNVKVQLQLTGVSVSVPPDTYSTTVTYTIIDT